MKKIFFVVGISLLGLGAVTAHQNQAQIANDTEQVKQDVKRKKVNQRGKHHVKSAEQTAEMRVARLEKDIELTPEQRKQMIEVYKASQEEAKAQRRQSRTDFETARRNILTKEQITVLEEKKGQRKASIDNVDNRKPERVRTQSKEDRSMRHEIKKNK